MKPFAYFISKSCKINPSLWNRLTIALDNDALKLSNNFKLTYQKEEGVGQHEFNTAFLTCHILKSKIDKLCYLTSYFIDLDDSNCMPEYSIFNSFKSLKDAKKSSSTILKKFKTKGVYPSTTWLKKWNNEKKHKSKHNE